MAVAHLLVILRRWHLYTRIRSSIFLALIITVLATFSGCGGGGETSTSTSTSDSGSGSGAPGGSGPLPAKVLSWDPPTSYVDTTPMDPVKDLDRFEIHVNESGSFTDTDSPLAAVSAVDPTTHHLTTSFDLANLSPHLTVGPHYFVSLRAVALTGLKSSYSPPVSFSF
jgi:hypothetical protein